VDKPRILLVEDDIVAAEEIKGELERMEYSVPAIFTSGEAALAGVHGAQPDLILLKIDLEGGMDSATVAKRLQETLDIPIVYIAACYSEGTLQLAESGNSSGILIRPFREFDLKLTIALALHKHRMGSTLKQSWNWVSAAFSLDADGLIVSDPKGHIMFFNDHFVRLTGWTKEEVLGRPMSDLLSIRPNNPMTPAGYSPIRLAQPKAAEPYNHGMLRLKEGREEHVTLRPTPILDQQGIMFGLWLVFRKNTNPWAERAGTQTGPRAMEKPYVQQGDPVRNGILLASVDHIVRLGVRHAILHSPELVIAAEALDPDQLDLALSRHPRGLLVIDSSFWVEGSGDFLDRLKITYPDLRILLLCARAHTAIGLHAVDIGVSCYLTTTNSGELVHAIKAISSGLQYIDSHLLGLKTNSSAGISSTPLHEALSNREAIVFRLIVFGKSNKQIASELNLSVKTVSTYRNRILKKLHMRSTSELVSYALKHNIMH